ncbi:hypothetical protein SAMN04487826_0442 [Prevotella sp. khp1]|nr:hypothetical protein SAMN04487826_0442 [Prevotella sp. khp1]
MQYHFALEFNCSFVLGWVSALLGDDDYPYAVPISYVYYEGKLYFHSALNILKSS